MNGGVAVEQHPAVPQPGFFHMPKIELPKYQRAASHIPFHVQKYPLSAPGSTVTPQQNAQPVMPDARTPQPAPGEATSSDPTNSLFDGKRMRKAVIRKTVDYNSAVVRYIENRVWQRDGRDHRAIQPDSLYELYMNPPNNMLEKSMNCLTTKFMRQSTNKFRCPIFCLAWTPEGRRLVTGASSGEFTLWNGLTFNFETILQAHESSVRAMRWSHNDQWMITADHAGFIKYWQSNMNNVKMYQGHKEPIRSLSFCPTDAKFASSSDDGTVRIWDFLRCHEEKILRGHGADVKCVDWHPQKSLVASGSKDNQVPIKLWDPKSGASLATLHAHKFTVMDLKWSKNGLWLLTASRDHLVKLFDVRNMKEEVQVFKGHKKEATSVAWHPINETIFCSGGSDGSIMFWQAGTEKELGSMEEAHDAIIWDLAWHPLGHILSSASNDHSTKFWTRNRPGDTLRDKYNLNTLPIGPDGEVIEEDQLVSSSSTSLLPGMGLEHGLPPVEEEKPKSKPEDELPSIPGLDWSSDMQYIKEQQLKEMPQRKKMPFARPIPKCFEQAWISNQQPGLLVKEDDEEEGAGEKKSRRRDRRVPRSKIKSLLSLSMPDRPPPGLRDVDLTEFDESGGGPRGPPKSEPPHSVGHLPPELDVHPVQEEMPPKAGILGNAPRPEYGEDMDFRFARDIVPAGMDQDYRADQDYRGDQDLRSDLDYRMDRDLRGQNEPVRDNFRGPNDSVSDNFRDQFGDSRDSFGAPSESKRESLRDLFVLPKDEFRNEKFESPHGRGRGRGHGGFMGHRGDRHGPSGDQHGPPGEIDQFSAEREYEEYEAMEHDFKVPKGFDSNKDDSFGFGSQSRMSDDSGIEPHEMMDFDDRHSPSPGPGFRAHDRGRNDSFRGGGNVRGRRGGPDNVRGGRGRGDFRGGRTPRGGSDSFRGDRNRNEFSPDDSDNFRGGSGEEFKGDMSGGNVRGDMNSNFRGNQGRGAFQGGHGGNDQDRGIKRNRDDSSERSSWGGEMGDDNIRDDGLGDSGAGIGDRGGQRDDQGGNRRGGFQERGGRGGFHGRGGRGGGNRDDQGNGGRGGFQGRGGKGGSRDDQGDSGRGGFQGRGGRGGSNRDNQGEGGRGGFQGRGGRGGSSRDNQGESGRGGFQGRGGRGGSRDDQGDGGRGGFQGRGGRGGFRGGDRGGRGDSRGGRGDGRGRGRGGPRGGSRGR